VKRYSARLLLVCVAQEGLLVAAGNNCFAVTSIPLRLERLRIRTALQWKIKYFTPSDDSNKPEQAPSAYVIRKVMVDPVMTKYGHINYECATIFEWIGMQGEA
jgi:hypothetical protein